MLATGYINEEIEAAKKADQWRPLVARLNTAERAGLDPASAATRGTDTVTQSLTRLDKTLGRWIEDRRQYGRFVDSSRTRGAAEVPRSTEPQI